MRVLYIEPFHGGSHRRFGEVLIAGIEAAGWEVDQLLLPDRHWKWRMRGAAVHLALEHGALLRSGPDLLLAGSYLGLAELRGLVPELTRTPAVLYFHENQLTYPVQAGVMAERDHHFGVSQMISALAAQHCAFNSAHNLDSFLAAGAHLLERMPDCPWPNWRALVEARSSVLPLPLELPALGARPRPAGAAAEVPVILWNHRWEHDKAPDDFLTGLQQLAETGQDFRLILLGRASRQEHPARAEVRRRFDHRILHCGEVARPDEYWQLLQRADIAVSAARHEFFGIAMLEAAWAGAAILVPDALAYPELFPPACRYPAGGLGAALRAACRGSLDGCVVPAVAEQFTAAAVIPRYLELFRRLCAGPEALA